MEMEAKLRLCAWIMGLSGACGGLSRCSGQVGGVLGCNEQAVDGLLDLSAAFFRSSK